MHELLNGHIINHGGDFLQDPRTLEHGIGPLQHMINSHDRAPYGMSQLLANELREYEMRRAQIIWLVEELNVAWDAHEITAEQFDDVITFFRRHRKRPEEAPSQE